MKWSAALAYHLHIASPDALMDFTPGQLYGALAAVQKLTED